MLTKLYVYEDGDRIGEVEIDILNMKEVKQNLDQYFDCGEDIDDSDVEMNLSNEEVYIGLNEFEYLWNL
jgi:hypothetical protein